MTYIAKRPNVDKIDDSWKYEQVSQSQEQLIAQLLKDFPEAKDSFEYKDYLSAPNKGTASEFITRTLEENLDRIEKRDNYVRYIANRPGAERFGTHGLFTDANIPIDLNAVAEEAANHDGILMTQVLSLKREDAARLGYETGEAWRDLLRSKAPAMAKAMNIPLEDLRWYAAFHNESHHPHCHIISYSMGKEPYMTQEGLMNLKSEFARAIFRHDLYHTYEAQTQYRDALSQESRDRIREIVAEVNNGTYENERVQLMLRELTRLLRKAKGKKVYGYLPQTARDLVNNIIDELAKDERISELYGLWYQQRDEVVRTYRDSAEDRLPLSQNKTFHAIKNIVVQETLGLAEEMQSVEEEAEEKANAEFDFTIPSGTEFVDSAESKTQETPREAGQQNYVPSVLPSMTVPVRKASLRLLSALARMLQEDMEQEQNQRAKLRVDKKQLQKIAEKKQAQGLRMG